MSYLTDLGRAMDRATQVPRLTRAEERLVANRLGQLALINVKGILAVGTDDKTTAPGKVTWDGDINGFPRVQVKTAFGLVSEEISWDLLDNLALAASKGSVGKVQF